MAMHDGSSAHPDAPGSDRPLGDPLAEQVSAVVAAVLGRRTNGRRAPSDEKLSADRIVAVAIDQMREHGYDAVTMRSIARELGTGPASLYAHVANRAELDQLVVGRVCAQWELPDPDPDRWTEQVRDGFVDLLELCRANPGVARSMLGMVPLEPGVLVSSERLLALLKAGDVSDQHAAWFVDVACLFVASVAVEEDIWRQRAQQGAHPVDEQAVVADVRAVFEQLPPEHFPLLSSMAATLTSGTADDRFRFGLDLLVGGLAAQGATPGRPPDGA